eukprot:3985594-Amphidinium_carterae.1
MSHCANLSLAVDANHDLGADEVVVQEAEAHLVIVVVVVVVDRQFVALSQSHRQPSCASLGAFVEIALIGATAVVDVKFIDVVVLLVNAVVVLGMLCIDDWQQVGYPLVRLELWVYVVCSVCLVWLAVAVEVGVALK